MIMITITILFCQNYAHKTLLLSLLSVNIPGNNFQLCLILCGVNHFCNYTFPCLILKKLIRFKILFLMAFYKYLIENRIC